MSSSLKISKQQQQDGSSRRRRMPEALRPEHIPVDERNRGELLAFAKALSAEIRYYDDNNTESGNWEAFFADEIAEREPHKALFITFLELLKYAQEHLNTLTQRHLDFYYREILRLKEKPAVPDRVHVLFQPAKNVKSHFLQAGTLLNAGKDDTGVPLYYATEKDILINKATIGSVKTLFIEKNDSNATQKIHAASVAGAADGMGGPFEGDNPRREIFGNSTKEEQAAIGFAMASPLLFIEEGGRTVGILLTFQETSLHEFENADTLWNELRELDMDLTFRVQLSGPKQWIEGTVSTTDRDDSEHWGSLNDNQIGITIHLQHKQPAVTAYNRETHGGRFDTIFPVVQLLLKDHSKYDLLYPLELTAVDLSVNVTGVKNLVLSNDQGALDPARPFLPFGPQPVLGSSFYIGSGEVFQKRLESLTLNIDWLDAPTDFPAHYLEYGPVNTADFQAQMSLLYEKSWIPVLMNGLDPAFDPNFKLFSGGDITDQEIGSGEAIDIPAFLDTGAAVEYNHNSDPKEIVKYDQDIQTGFTKLELSGPSSPFNAFGHREYPHLLTQQTIAMANGTSTDPLPNAPYTPAIKSLSLDYSATQTIDFPNNGDNGVEAFFHIRPFGHTKHAPDDSPSLLPEYRDEGNLYIGIKDLEPPQQLSILFLLEGRSTDPDINIRTEDIHWSYLTDGQWTPLAAQQLVSDTTRAFQATGIITFNIPSDASGQGGLMPEGFHWLKASLTTAAERIGKFIALNTQAVTAVFSDRGNDPSRLNRALDPNSISGLVHKQAAVKSVLQPYPSFNGRAAEQNNVFYTRISELLRHKARAISGWDYERLILEKFPAIYKVKCLDHTGIDIQDITNSSENKAGHVTIIALSGAIRKNAVNSLEPKTDSKTLMAIGDYIRKYMSPFVSIDVRNPIYEPVQLSFKVRFTEDTDQGYYQQLLEEEVSRFLSPWAYEDGAAIAFGNEIYKSTVLNFVEERPYVDFITDFTLYHTFGAVLSGSRQADLIDPEQNVYHIFYDYPYGPDREIALEFIVEFDGAVVTNIPDYIPGFLANIDHFFAMPPGEKKQSEIKRTEVIKFIEAHSEVAFVRELRFFHIEGTNLKEDTESALAARPGAILTSARTHEIGLLNIDHQCPVWGIDYMTVGIDFVVRAYLKKNNL